MVGYLDWIRTNIDNDTRVNWWPRLKTFNPPVTPANWIGVVGCVAIECMSTITPVGNGTICEYP